MKFSLYKKPAKMLCRQLRSKKAAHNILAFSKGDHERHFKTDKNMISQFPKNLQSQFVLLPYFNNKPLFFVLAVENFAGMRSGFQTRSVNFKSTIFFVFLST